jgi:hypothetical protein
MLLNEELSTVASRLRFIDVIPPPYGAPRPTRVEGEDPALGSRLGEREGIEFEDEIKPTC